MSLESSSKPNVNNGAPNSITGNTCVNNYVNDLEHNSGVTINDALSSSSNTKSNNKHYTNRYPSDPYWLGYEADRITDRMISGDFDNDGFEDDVAAFYDYSGETRIHVWKSTGTNNAFEYSSSIGWWQGQTLTASLVNRRVVTGDFDRDGYKDDIAAFYDYGNGSTRIYVWKSTGSSFSQIQTWWNVAGYDANKISGRIVSGDFDRDGYEDDIAAFYDYGTNTSEAKETRIHVWKKSTGSSFSYSGSQSWRKLVGYNAQNITGRVISGDFDRDGYKDDIAAFYDYGNDQTRIHTWTSTGSSFLYTSSSGWWNTFGYTASNISGRIVAGDFDKDGKLDDITAFYDYSSALGSVRSNVWQSTGSEFSYINQSMGYPWLTDFSYYEGGGSTGLLARIEPNQWEVNENKFSIKIYPNPGDDFILFSAENTPFQLKIFNLQGEQVFNKKVKDKTYELVTSEFISGIYLYQIRYKGDVYNGKIVIK